MSDNYDISQELKQIKEKIVTLQRDLSSHRDEIINDLKTVEVMRERIIKKVEHFRGEINQYLDNAKRDLLDKIDEIKTKQVSQLKHNQREFEKMATEMKECEKKIHRTSDKINDLFVAAKVSNEKIKACHITEKCENEILSFVKSKEFVKLLTNKCPIGEINTQKERRMITRNRKGVVNAQTKLLNCLTIRYKKDRYDCILTRMVVVSCDEFLLVDNNNRTLKILNVNENKITSTFTTDDDPWDITTIDAGTFAVTITKGEIVIINVTKKISKSHSIKNCGGIDYRNGILAVSFDNLASVQLLDMKGTILQEIDISARCSDPWYIVLSNDSNSFVISDYYNDTLYEFSIDGNLNGKITSDDMISPRGLARTGEGTVIVCCQNTSDRLAIVTQQQEKFCLFL